MVLANNSHDIRDALLRVPEATRAEELNKYLSREREGRLTEVDAVILQVLRDVGDEAFQGPNSRLISAEREKMIGRILTRYASHQGSGLYGKHPPHPNRVDGWLRLNPTLLDWAIGLEARGGMPIITGFDVDNSTYSIAETVFFIGEGAEEVPRGIRNICYGPDDAVRAGLPKGYSALVQAQALGGSLMGASELAELMRAGIVKKRYTEQWVLSSTGTGEAYIAGNESYGASLAAGYDCDDDYDEWPGPIRVNSATVDSYFRKVPTTERELKRGIRVSLVGETHEK